jgi:predicted pyridoxine 5'-phosphate oxidase superfamily flavin-nucleotide-binding protein
MRPTNFCHLNDLRAPVPRAFPAHSATFIAWTPHGVLGSVRLTGVPSVSRHSRTLRRIAAGHTLPCLESAGGFERGRCLPTVPADRSSL